MRPLWFCIFSDKYFEKKIENLNVTLHLLEPTIWENIWKFIREKNQTYATSATLHLYRQVFEKTFKNSLWRNIIQMSARWLCICSDRRFDIWKFTLEKNCTNVSNVSWPWEFDTSKRHNNKLLKIFANSVIWILYWGPTLVVILILDF